MPKLTEDKLKAALLQDFSTLYVKEFTTDWKVQRVIRGLEIQGMSFPNTMKLIEKGAG